jgi:hypothetical protein
LATLGSGGLGGTAPALSVSTQGAAFYRQLVISTIITSQPQRLSASALRLTPQPIALPVELSMRGPELQLYLDIRGFDKRLQNYNAAPQYLLIPLIVLCNRRPRSGNLTLDLPYAVR